VATMRRHTQHSRLQHAGSAAASIVIARFTPSQSRPFASRSLAAGTVGAGHRVAPDLTHSPTHPVGTVQSRPFAAVILASLGSGRASDQRVPCPCC
jgi:hypothetical protein